MSTHRPSIDDYQQDITQLKTAGATHEEVLDWLTSYGVNTTISTLKRRLQQWGVRTNNAHQDLPLLTAQIDHIYNHSRQTDSQIAETLRDNGADIKPRQVKKLRLASRNLMRNNDVPTQQSQQQATHQAMGDLVLYGTGRRFGNEWARTHLARKFGLRTRQKDVVSGLRLANAAATAARYPLLRKQRLENLIVDGPNQLWCMDGHDKLSQWGFQIYAAVDAYSRKVLWVYCGNTSRSKRSVLAQFLYTIQEHQVCPRYIRTDCGSETFDLCCAQFRLFLEQAFKEDGWSNQELQSLRASDCYIDGPSTRNVRIEGLWRTLGDEVTRAWSRLFKVIQADGLFNKMKLAGNVVTRFVFMKLIRTELVDFMLDRNERPIRKQKNREYHVAGIPNKLYSTPITPARQCGFEPDAATCRELTEPLSEYGKLLSLPHSPPDASFA
jgi:hypothetical protein